ncbi:MAG: urate hydroxylase PuuD [Alphaproteobacteria bacterium]|nr:urate hydroxylase PuuD [Alphaproteobacteria bacterium]
METVLMEWVDLAVRWVHVIAGIAWIGSSFYFVHLDLSLKQREGLPEGAGGEAWQVHGGGFYNMVKYLVAPARMPDSLTWFKWEAYATWISGVALLVIVYYMAAELYLIDRAVLDLEPWMAIAISVVGLAIGWIIYDLLCRSPLGRNDVALAAVGFLFLVLLAWLFTLVFSGRGAFMQMGTLIGTMMVANVFFVIIPNQRKVVAELVAGGQPDPELGRQGKQRSLHNNYLTLPVLFVMIGNHYPLAFASQWNWLILAIVLVIGALIRHFYNTRHKGDPSPWWTWGVSVAGMALIVWLSALPAPVSDEAAAEVEVDTAEVESVVLSYCSMCHAAEPIWEGMAVAPKGVVLETPEQIRLQAKAIWLQTVHTRAMPPGNVTEMSDDERQILAAWIAAGAPAWESE